MPLQRRGFLFGLVTLAVARGYPAYAHPPGVPHDGSALSEWFAQQHNVNGGWCCKDSDAYYLSDEDWTTTKNGYKVKIGNEWFDVPRGALRDPKGGVNPTPNAILWYMQEDGEGPKIYCFSPGFTY
jgi:hypothetical protein